jgi:transposase
MDEMRALETRVAGVEKRLRHEARQRPAARKPMDAPGIGLPVAAALVAAVGGMEAFRDGRRLAAWLGLAPKESSGGNRRKLGRIGKRGDPRLRALPIRSARSALNAVVMKLNAGKDLTRPQRWAVGLAGRVGHDKAACAPANKLARIAFAAVRQGRDFDGDFLPAPAKTPAAQAS